MHFSQNRIKGFQCVLVPLSSSPYGIKNKGMEPLLVLVYGQELCSIFHDFPTPGQFQLNAKSRLMSFRAELRNESSMPWSILLYCHISSQWYLLHLYFRGLLAIFTPSPSLKILSEQGSEYIFLLNQQIQLPTLCQVLC